MGWNIKEDEHGVSFCIRVQPKSSKNEILGIVGEEMKIKLTAPPVEGEANKECIKFLARELGISKSSIRIIGGERSRNKVLRITGITKKEIEDRLL
jgi:hypothetical protein